MQYRSGAALILLAGFIWSTQGLGLRMITEAQAWTVMTWRSLGLVIALTLFIAITTRGQVWAAITSVGRSGLLGGLVMVLAFGGAIYAMQTTTIANAVVLFAAAPFFAALIGWALLGEKVPLATWAAIALAMVGIAVMVGGQIDLRGLWGNLAALISAFGFGAFSVALRSAPAHVRAGSGQFPIVLLSGIFSVIIGFALAIATGQNLLPPLPDIGISMGMGAITLAGGMLIYTIGTRAVPAAAATLLAQIEVILAPLWVWLLLGEQISGNTALGGAIVLGALLLNVLASNRTPISQPTS
jgi:DME family drug/metabolite transporter